MPRIEEQRGLAARVAGSADLQDVRLFGVGASLETPDTEGNLSYTMSSDISFQTVGEPVKSLIVTGEYEVVVTEPARETSGNDEPERVCDVRFTLAALYAVIPHDDHILQFDDHEYEAFAATTGQFTLYPYAREFISDLTSRMGLPALHIGALRFDLDSRNGD